MKNPKQVLTKVFSGTTWALFTMFVWELIEEGLESLIAYALSSAFAVFMAKVLSTLSIVTATQLVKVPIKRFLYPIIRNLIYKEGNDKMNLIKKYFTKVWGNKFTGLFSAVPFGLIAYYQPFIPVLTHCWWFALIVAVVFFNVAIFVGGETLQQIVERFAKNTDNKKLKAKLKEVEKAKEIVAKYEKAKETLANQPTEVK